MGRRLFLGGILVAAIAAGAWYWHTHLSGPRWNVVVVTLSSARADHIGCYGHASAKTPALDGLSERGVLFERAYAAAPITLPSHATIFTALHPQEHGLLTDGKGRLAGDVETLAEILAASGYETGAFVGAYTLDSRFGLDQGFGTYDDDLNGTPRPPNPLNRERPGSMVVDRALEWLKTHTADRFCCWIQLNDPQLPHVPHPADDVDPFAEAPYDGEVAFADQQLGRVLDFLKQQKLDDKTLVVVVGDHGEGLGDHDEQGHGYLLHDSTLRVPLVIHRPGQPAAGTRIKEPVSLVDLSPTLLDLLGASTQRKHNGSSLASVFNSGAAPAKACYSATLQPLLDNGWSPLKCVTTAEWRYVRSTVSELYDLKADPAETSNLAGSQPERAAELDKLLSELDAKLQPNEAAAETVSAGEKRALAIFGGTAAQAILPDVKDKLALLNRLNEAVALLEKREAAAAEPILREIVADDPRYLKAKTKLGVCLSQLGKFDEAAACFQEVLAIHEADVESLLSLGGVHVVQEKYPDAMQVFRKAVAADPHSADPPLQLGLLHQQMGDEGQAEMMFALAIERDPAADAVMCAQGELALQQGDGDRALERYYAALNVNPKSVPALINVGIVAAQQGEIDMAETLFKMAVEVEPLNPLPRLNLARIATYRGHPEDTATDLEAILKDTPNDVPTVLALGWIRAASPVDSLRNPEQAQQLADQAVTLAGRESPEALDLLAASQAEAGKFQDAVNTMDEVVRLAQANNYQKESIEQMAQRYMLYANGRKYRSEPVKPPGEQAHDHPHPQPGWNSQLK